jgi:hypothetical protein
MLTINGIQLQFGRLRSARYRSPTSVSCAINVLPTSAIQIHATLDATCRTGPGSRAVRQHGVRLVRLCASEPILFQQSQVLWFVDFSSSNDVLTGGVESVFCV